MFFEYCVFFTHCFYWTIFLQFYAPLSALFNF